MPILVMSAFLVAILILLSTGSYSSLFFSLFILMFGSGIIQMMKTERGNAYKLLYLSFSFYGLLALLHYIDVVDFHNYTYSDESTAFVPFVENNLSKSLLEIWSNAIFDSLGNYYGYLIYITLCGKIGFLFDGYNKMLIFLSSVLVSCIYIIFLYRLLLLVLSSDKAYKYTLLYLFMSPIVLYSFVALRDIHIALFYLLGFYVLYSEKNFVKGLVYLFILTIILFTFRIENGYFFSLIILYYVYKRFSSYKILCMALIIVMSLIGVVFISETFMATNETLETYNEYTKNNANIDGMAMKILNLPFPIKEIVCTLLSQVFPIPPWAIFEMITPKGLPAFVIALMNPIKTIFWFYVIFSFVNFLLVKKIRYYIGNKYKWSLIISLIFIVICSTEYYEVRRLMCVYPVIYMCFCDVRNKVSSKEYVKINRRFVFCYGGFLLFFLLLFR